MMLRLMGPHFESKARDRGIEWRISATLLFDGSYGSSRGIVDK
jgi:hypothetical protein